MLESLYCIKSTVVYCKSILCLFGRIFRCDVIMVTMIVFNHGSNQFQFNSGWYGPVGGLVLKTRTSDTAQAKSILSRLSFLFYMTLLFYIIKDQ